MSSLFLSFLLRKKFILKKNLFFWIFSKKKKKKIGEGKKSFVPACLCRSRQILGYVCRPIKGSQLTHHVQLRLTCLPSNSYVFLFKQISCLQSVVCEYSVIFIYLHLSLCKSPCSDVFSGFIILQNSKRVRMRESECICIYIYIYSLKISWNN